MLSVRIKKQLGGFRLNVDFETDGEILGLLGASGCGKSMTLKCIAGIEQPDEGRVVLDGKTLFDSRKRIDLKPQQRRVGYLFQQYALFPNMTVRQNIHAGSREKDDKKKEAAVADMIRSMRLENMEQKRPHQISGGQQQRAALARILINEPDILLLDEPFTALDSYLKWQVELEVADMLKKFGRGAILVTHSRDEVYRLCDSVCVLQAGKSEGRQKKGALFESPVTLAACLLSGCKNFSRIHPAEDGIVEALDWGVRLKLPGAMPEGATHVGIRAHYITVSGEPSGENSFSCTVERVVEDIFSTVLMLSPGDGCSLLRVEGEKDYLGTLKTGQKVYAGLPSGSLMPVRE